jgi:hypothetical protein
LLGTTKTRGGYWYFERIVAGWNTQLIHKKRRKRESSKEAYSPSRSR